MNPFPETAQCPTCGTEVTLAAAFTEPADDGLAVFCPSTTCVTSVPQTWFTVTPKD